MGTTPYTSVCTQNNNPVNFEMPHNYLHGEVGGEDGDMSDPRTASWDPIFYLHHSNVERMQFAWIKNHPTPAPTMGTSGKFSNSAPLYPFPSRNTFATQGGKALPWLRPADPNDISTVGEWLANANLGYTYSDDDTDPSAFGPRASSRRLFAMAVPNSSRQAAVKKVFKIRNVSARGTGAIKTKLRIGTTTFDLQDKYIFAFKKEFFCVNCETVDLTLAWNVYLTPEQAANIGKTKLVSFKFKGEDISEGIEAGWVDDHGGFTALASGSSSSSSSSAPPSKKRKTDKGL